MERRQGREGGREGRREGRTCFGKACGFGPSFDPTEEGSTLKNGEKTGSMKRARRSI